MDDNRQKTFSQRMRRFGAHRSPATGELPLSIKIRVTSGCFHREHSPYAYSLIDKHLNALTGDPSTFAFEEHESGPELLVFLAVATAGITLAKSVIDLVTVIIKARSGGPIAGLRKLVGERHGPKPPLGLSHPYSLEHHGGAAGRENDQLAQCRISGILQRGASQREGGICGGWRATCQGSRGAAKLADRWNRRTDHQAAGPYGGTG